MNQYCQITARTSRGGPLRKGILLKKSENVVVFGKQPHFGLGHNRIVPPRAERSKPQVPVESRLIGRVKPRWRTEVLGLIAERICHPGFSIFGPLELDLVSASGHDAKEAVSISDAKRLKRLHRRGWQW